MISIQVVCHFQWFCLSGTAAQRSGGTPEKNFLGKVVKTSQPLVTGWELPQNSEQPLHLLQIRFSCDKLNCIVPSPSTVFVCSVSEMLELWNGNSLKSPRATVTPHARRENCFRHYPTPVWVGNTYSFTKNLRTEDVGMVSVCVSCINTENNSMLSSIALAYPLIK